MQKKGELSRLAVNLLIGSLIIILGVIIWIILRGGSADNHQVFTDENIDLKISQVKKIDDNTLDLNLKRGAGEGNFIGLSFAVSDGSLTEVIRINSSMPENQTGNFSLDFISLNASKVKKVSVTPIYLNEEGVEVIGNVKDEYITPNTCSNYCPTGAQCGYNDCGMNCGNGCGKGYLCLNYKCIKEKTSSGGGGSSGGGSNDDDDDDDENETVCTDTCASLGYTCGDHNICGSTLTCGNCSEEYNCQTNGTCMKIPCSDTCESLGYGCGNQTVCGEITTCGNCQSGYTCQVSNGTCMKDCTPTTCAALGRNCGTVSDGCGNTLTCGSYGGGCQTGYTCQVSNGTCIPCTTHSTSNCSNGDVYWWNSCGQREEIRYDCNSTQTCVGGSCVAISPTCSDGIQNQGEIGIDCGGPCAACPTGTVYYVSNSGSDSAAGTSSSTAWKTISKINGRTFQPGDAILFERGGIWHETLSVSSSGNLGNPITFGAYGSGERPLITGFTTISSWTSESGGIYYSVVSAQAPKIVSINGKNTPIGRTPNTGFLTYESASGSSGTCTITDTSLSSSPSWTGAEVVIRKNDWVLDRNPITAHSGNTITYYNSENPGGGPYAGNGYFFQNHKQTLDIFGEWYYDGSRLYVYFGTENPNNYVVKISSLNESINILNKRYIVIDNLHLEGASKNSINVGTSSSYVTIQNCVIDFTGVNAIDSQSNSNYLTVNNNLINNSNGIALSIMEDNAVVTNNQILNTGVIPGSFTTWGSRSIFIYSDNGLVQYNTIINVGYNGMQIKGNNLVVDKNLIDTFCTLMDDGAGIYTQDMGHSSPITISNNIILNGFGNFQGTTSSEDIVSGGIYLDSNSYNLNVTGNTVVNCKFAGIKLASITNTIVKDNNCYNNDRQIEFLENNNLIAGNDIQNNILVARTTSQSTLSYGTSSSTISSIGTLDYNYYSRPLNDANSLNLWKQPWGTYPWPGVPISFATWKSLSNKDAHTLQSPKSINSVNDLLFEYNPTKTNKVVTLTGNYVDIKGVSYSESVTLPPYTSIVLIKN